MEPAPDEPTEAQWLAAHLKAVISDDGLYDVGFDNGTRLTKEQVERIIKELLRSRARSALSTEGEVKP